VVQIYRILDVRVSLQTDDGLLFRQFDTNYRLFREDVAVNPPAITSDLCVRACLNVTSPQLVLNESEYSLEGHPDPRRLAFLLILQEIYRRVRNFILIHASVAVRDNKALVLSGRAGIGKTTLLMSLLKEGFTCFSDDICPLEKDSGLVFPFPRTAWIERARQVGPTGVRRLKDPICVVEDVAQLSPCPPGCVVCLDAPRREEEITLHVQLRTLPADPLVEELSLPGVSLSLLGGSPPVLCVRFKNDSKANSKIRSILDHHARQIWAAVRVHEEGPDFQTKPEARRISPSEAAIWIVRELKQDFLLPDSHVSPGRLLFQISSLLQDANIYRVTTGIHGELVKLVKGLWKEG